MTNGADPFWDAMRAGMEQAEKELEIAAFDLDAVMDTGDSTSKTQIEKLKNFANSTDVAAVAISLTDANSPGLINAMRALQDQGIPVITVDSDVNRNNARDARFAYIGTDNVVGGRQAGLAVKALRPEGGGYVSFVGLKSAANAVERHDGMAQAVGDKFTELDYLADDMDRNKAQKNVKDAINNHGDKIGVFYGIWAYNAHAIVQSVDSSGDLRDKTSVVVFDAAENAIRHMGDGKIDAMVVQNPYQMGQVAVELMTALVNKNHDTIKKFYPKYDDESGEISGKAEGSDIYTTELRVVVPDKGSPIKPDDFDEGIIFFKHSEFKKWLDERRLTSS